MISKIRFSQIVRDQIKFGLEGGNEGISMGNNKINQVLCGVQKARYDLIGGSTGSGKTAMVDSLYVINPLIEVIEGRTEFDLNILYYSLEISFKVKLVKWACLMAYYKHKIVIDIKETLSMGKNKLAADKLIVLEATYEFLDQISDKVYFHTGKINPTGIHKQVRDYALLNGTLYDPDGSVITHRTFNNKMTTPKQKKVDKYVAKNPKLVTEIICDHIGLPARESDRESKTLFSKKENIDKHSEYQMEHRDVYGFTPIDVSQYNRELSDIQRIKFGELRPQLEDFKDTGNTQENADTVIAMLHPRRYNINTYMGYDLTKGSYTFGERFRPVFILKNRNGLDIVGTAFRFIGENGHFAQLPKSKFFEVRDVLYNEVLDLNKLEVV